MSRVKLRILPPSILEAQQRQLAGALAGLGTA